MKLCRIKERGSHRMRLRSGYDFPAEKNSEFGNLLTPLKERNQVGNAVQKQGELNRAE